MRGVIVNCPLVSEGNGKHGEASGHVVNNKRARVNHSVWKDLRRGQSKRHGQDHWTGASHLILMVESCCPVIGKCPEHNARLFWLLFFTLLAHQ